MSKILTGVVVSNKANKTITVLVEARKTHPIYKKQYTRSQKIAAHDETNSANIGDKVNIVETRPISATKRFKLVEVTTKASIAHVEETEPVVKPVAAKKIKEPKAAKTKVVEE